MAAVTWDSPEGLPAVVIKAAEQTKEISSQKRQQLGAAARVEEDGSVSPETGLLSAKPQTQSPGEQEGH